MQYVQTGFLISSLLAAAVFAADTPKPASNASSSQAKANLQLIMLTKVNPQGLALWDITNAAMGDTGDVDPKLMKAADWAALLEHGKALEEGGRALAGSNGVIVALPGAKLQDEANAGASKAADVQRYIDANPAEFRKHALALQKTGSKIITAATQRNVKLLGEVSNDLDAVCEACHVKFWYPQQKK